MLELRSRARRAELGRIALAAAPPAQPRLQQRPARHVGRHS